MSCARESVRVASSEVSSRMILLIAYLLSYAYAYSLLYDFSMETVVRYRKYMITKGLAVVSQEKFASEFENFAQRRAPLLSALIELRVERLQKALVRRLLLNTLWLTPFIVVCSVLDRERLERRFKERLFHLLLTVFSSQDPLLSTILRGRGPR